MNFPLKPPTYHLQFFRDSMRPPRARFDYRTLMNIIYLFIKPGYFLLSEITRSREYVLLTCHSPWTTADDLSNVEPRGTPKVKNYIQLGLRVFVKRGQVVSCTSPYADSTGSWIPVSTLVECSRCHHAPAARAMLNILFDLSFNGVQTGKSMHHVVVSQK